MLKNNFEKRVSLENWTKNHKTGQFEQVTKIKPATFMKGRAHIEVFDKDGNIEQEAVTENVINNSINAHYSMRLMFGIEAFPNQGSMAKNTIPFGRMILNNYTTAESASLSVMPNSLTYPTIGWAHRISDYAGSDLLRGDYNASESSYDYDSTPNVADYTLVYDWNTDQANGTFQSIFWVPDSYSIGTVTTEAEAYIGDIIDSYSGSTAYGQGFIKNDSRYRAQSGKIYKTGTPRTWNSNLGRLAGAETEILDYSSDVTTPGVYDGIITDGDNFYILVVADNKIYKYNSSLVYQSNFTFTWSTYMSDDALITCSSNRIWTIKYISTTETNLYEFDLSGTLQATHNLYTDIAEAFVPTGICFDGTNLLISSYSNQRMAIYDTSGNIVSYLNCSIENANDAYGCMYNTLTRGYYHSDGSNEEGYVFNPAPSAHTLLASPVTKTSANTMKITYTFSFDLTAL